MWRNASQRENTPSTRPANAGLDRQWSLKASPVNQAPQLAPPSREDSTLRTGGSSTGRRAQAQETDHHSPPVAVQALASAPNAGAAPLTVTHPAEDTLVVSTEEFSKLRAEPAMPVVQDAPLGEAQLPTAASSQGSSSASVGASAGSQTGRVEDPLELQAFGAPSAAASPPRSQRAQHPLAGASEELELALAELLVPEYPELLGGSADADAGMDTGMPQAAPAGHAAAPAGKGEASTDAAGEAAVAVLGGAPTAATGKGLLEGAAAQPPQPPPEAWQVEPLHLPPSEQLQSGQAEVARAPPSQEDDQAPNSQPGPARRRSSHAGVGPRALRHLKPLHKRISGHKASHGGAAHVAGAGAAVDAAAEATVPHPPEGSSAGGEEGKVEDILAELEAQRARHAEQLALEGKVRAELESMIARIEKHFLKEQTARKRAEEQAAQAAAERDALRALLEAERAQQAALAHAAGERGLGEEQREAELAAVRAELEAARHELAYRTHAMAAELAAWRSAADVASRQLQQQAQELTGAGDSMRQLAEVLLGTGAGAGGADAFGVAPGEQSAADLASGSEEAPGRGQPRPQPALQFKRSPGVPGGVPPVRPAGAKRGPGPAAGDGAVAASERSLPRLPTKKTQAVFGAQLRQPPDLGGGASSTLLPALGASPTRGQRERVGGVAWSAAADRFSTRDAHMAAHMAARWNRG